MARWTYKYLVNDRLDMVFKNFGQQWTVFQMLPTLYLYSYRHSKIYPRGLIDGSICNPTILKFRTWKERDPRLQTHTIAMIQKHHYLYDGERNVNMGFVTIYFFASLQYLSISNYTKNIPPQYIKKSGIMIQCTV